MLLRLFLILILLSSPLLSFSQSGSISPYSRYGIGDLSFSGFTHQSGMGAAGVAINDSFNINVLNPATFAAIKMFLFDAGLRGEFTRIYTAEDFTYKSQAGFNYLALGFPIVKQRAGASFGLVPYSNTGYEISSAGLNTLGDLYRITYAGTGGLSRAYAGVGSKVNRNISAGLSASYIFGSIKKTRSVVYPNDKTYYSIRETDNTRTSDFTFNYGLLFRFDTLFGVRNKAAVERFDSLAYDTLGGREKLRKNLARPVKFSIGLSGSVGNNLNGKYDLFAESYKISNFGNQLTRDTISYISDFPTTTTIATNFNLGFCLEDLYHFRIALDGNYENWRDFQSAGSADTLQNAYRVALGAEWTPDYKAKGYLKRVIYRTGFRYAQTRLNLNNTPLNDMAITFGLGLPISSANNKAFGANFTRLNFGFEIGNRGTTKNNLIQENYVRVNFGVVFTETWFLKRKYD